MSNWLCNKLLKLQRQPHQSRSHDVDVDAGKVVQWGARLTSKISSGREKVGPGGKYTAKFRLGPTFESSILLISSHLDFDNYYLL